MKKHEELKVRRASRGKAEVYKFAFEPTGWAIFMLADDTGTFAIESDWGSYTYSWPAPGRGKETLREFVATAGCDYMATKFSYEKAKDFRQQFDEDATRKTIKKDIAEARREKRIDADRSRELWDELDAWEMGNDHEFHCNMPHEIQRFYQGDYYELAVYSPSAAYRFLVNTLLPFFQKVLREELATEVKVAAVGQ